MTVSALRTIVLSSSLQSYGVKMTLRWPAAQPDDDLDYSIDATVPMTDVGDNIISASIAIAPSGAGELSIASLNIAGSVITAWLSGGVAGRDYTAKIEAQTVGGRTFEWLPHLLIDPQLAASPIPAAPNASFGTPVNASAAVPLILSLARPLSAGLAATLL